MAYKYRDPLRMMRYRADARVARPGESARVIEDEAKKRYDVDDLGKYMMRLGSEPFGQRHYERRLRERGEHDPAAGSDGKDDDDHRKETARRDRDEDEYHEPSMYRPPRGSREIIIGDGDPADRIRHPDHRRGYKYERRKHPDWTHEQLVVYVDRRLMGDRHAYDPERIAEEERTSRYARAPHRSDGCASCRHYVPYLDDDRAGCCGHDEHRGKQVLCDQICRHWER
jgi:hypothetical protein